MTRLLSKISVGLAAMLVTASLAVAQTTPATPTAPPAATPKTTVPAAAPKAPAAAKTTAEPVAKAGQKKASTPEGIVCSQKADEQKLTGKPRKNFRTKCIREQKAAAAKSGAPATKN